MQTKLKLISRAGLLALISVGWMPLSAQVSSPPAAPAADETQKKEEAVVLETFVVSGVAASMQKAQAIKRESLQIVDSIIADDINKLPDLSVTEALQRITGVSIQRDLGDGASVALRGLNEVTSSINGQEVFSPQVVTGESRQMNLQTIPSEMVAAINVYKTPSADMLEGGIAGTIDIRLRKPLDFDGKLNGYFSGRLVNGEAADATKFQYSGVLTDTWKVGDGKVGVLVNYTKQDRAIRQDLSSTGNPIILNTSSGPVIGYNGSYEPRFFAERNRDGRSVVLQWAPAKNLRFFAEYSHSQQETLQDSVAPWFTPSATVTDVVLYSGLTYLANHDNNAATPMVQVPVAQSYKVVGGNFNEYSIIRDWKERTQQFTAGGAWHGDNVTVEGEISRMESRSDFDNLGVYSTLTGVDYTHDVSSDVPAVLPVDPNRITIDRAADGTFAFWFYNNIINNADSTTGKVDATHRFESSSFFRSLKYGVRLAQRGGDIDRVSVSGGIPGHISDYPSLYGASKADNFFDGNPGKVNSFLEVKTAPLRGYSSFATLVGANPVLPGPQPTYEFDITEKTWAGYVMTSFASQSKLKFDGNVGVRVIGTDINSAGFKRLNGVYSPITLKGDYTDVLPSLNTRWFIGENLIVRFSASKQLSRQSFGKLRPNLTLTPPGTVGQIGTGSEGNPDLPPLRTDQFDIAIEKYFNESTYVYASVYRKQIDGYTQNATTLETIDGVQYNISRPYAVDGAEIQGAEFGYQQFFTFLPGLLSGLGVNANYTYIDANDPAGLPLTNLSKNGYNVIAMYEKGPWSGRVAYNWRDTFARSNSTNGGAIGTVPLYDKAFGWMDASLSYSVNQHLKVSLDVANVLRTHRESYYKETVFQNEDVLEDRQFYLSATWKL